MRSISAGVLLIGLVACGSHRGEGPPAPPPPPPQTHHLHPTGWPAVQTSLPHWSLSMAQADWDKLNQNIQNRQISVLATFGAEGRTWQVTARIRGWSTRLAPKKGFAISFPKSDPFLDGRTKLELIAEWQDGGYLEEKMWWDLAAAAGLRVPDAQYVNLDFNGSYYGIMLDLERPGGHYVENHDYTPGSDVFRSGMFDSELRELPQEPYQLPWTRETNSAAPFDPLWSFLRMVSETPSHQLPATLDQQMELDEFLTWLALDALIGNSYVQDAGIFLMRDAGTGKWTYVPWDLNNAVSLYDRKSSVVQGPMYWRPLMNFTVYDPWTYDLAALRLAGGMVGMKPPWNVLSTRIWDDENLRPRLVAKIQHLCDTEFREEVIGPRAEAQQALLAPSAANDPWVDPNYFARGAIQMRIWVRQRTHWVLSQLPSLAQHNASNLKIDKVGVDASGAPDVVILNVSSSPQDLGGLLLTGNLRVPNQWTLPATTLAPGASATFGGGAPGVNPSRPEVGLFQSDARTPIDVFYAPPLTPGKAYGRSPSGAESFGWQ